MLSLTRFTSRIAHNSVNFGLVLLVVDETGKAFLSSLLVLALVVPSTLAGIVGGAAADALPKRLLVFLGDIARAAVCLVFVGDSHGVGSYYLIGIALATVAPFATSAEGAIAPAIVARSDLARANALGHGIGAAAQIIGFGVVTPVILRVFDRPGILFGFAAALYAIAALYAVAIGKVEPIERKEVGGSVGGRWWQAGWRQMRSDRRVMQAAIELTLMSTSLIILAGLIPKYIEDVLDLPIDIGVLILMPGAAGVVLGLRVAGLLARRVAHAVLSSTGFVTFVVLLAMVTFVDQEASFLAGYGAFAWLNDVNIGSFDRTGVVAMVLVFPLGFSYAVVSVAGQTVLNDLVPLQLQGRVLATQAAMAAVASSVPVLLAGALADWFGVTLVMGLLSASVASVAIANSRSRGWFVESGAATAPKFD